MTRLTSRNGALAIMPPYDCLSNSISAGPEPLENLLLVAAQHDAAVFDLPIGGAGFLGTGAKRLEQIQVKNAICQRNCISQDDIIVDAICLANAALLRPLQVTLKTPQAITSDLKLTTTLGIEDAGFEMPEQIVMDHVNLIAAIPWGLYSALVNPKTAGLIETVRAIDFLLLRDQSGERYIQHYQGNIRNHKREYAL